MNYSIRPYVFIFLCSLPSFLQAVDYENFLAPLDAARATGTACLWIYQNPRAFAAGTTAVIGGGLYAGYKVTQTIKEQIKAHPFIFAGGASATFAGGYMWYKYKMLNKRNDEIAEQLDQLKEQNERLEQRMKDQNENNIVAFIRAHSERTLMDERREQDSEKLSEKIKENDEKNERAFQQAHRERGWMQDETKAIKEQLDTLAQNSQQNFTTLREETREEFQQTHAANEKTNNQLNTFAKDTQNNFDKLTDTLNEDRERNNKESERLNANMSEAAEKLEQTVENSEATRFMMENLYKRAGLAREIPQRLPAQPLPGSASATKENLQAFQAIKASTLGSSFTSTSFSTFRNESLNDQG